MPTFRPTYRETTRTVEATQFLASTTPRRVDIIERTHPRLGRIFYLKSGKRLLQINDTDWIVILPSGAKFPMGNQKFQQKYELEP